MACYDAMKAVLSSTIAVFLVGAVVRAQAGDPVAVRDRVHEALDALLAATQPGLVAQFGKLADFVL